MRFFYSIGLILLSLSIVVGCSSKPSETEARQNFEEMIHNYSNGLIKVASLKKTNGIENFNGSASLYKMEWNAKIELTCDCYWQTDQYRAMSEARYNPIKAILRRSWRPDQYLAMSEDPTFRGDIEHYKKGKKGEQFDVKGSSIFEKTENGWRYISGSNS